MKKKEESETVMKEEGKVSKVPKETRRKGGDERG